MIFINYNITFLYTKKIYTWKAQKKECNYRKNELWKLAVVAVEGPIFTQKRVANEGRILYAESLCASVSSDFWAIRFKTW